MEGDRKRQRFHCTTRQADLKGKRKRAVVYEIDAASTGTVSDATSLAGNRVSNAWEGGRGTIGGDSEFLSSLPRSQTTNLRGCGKGMSPTGTNSAGVLSVLSRRTDAMTKAEADAAGFTPEEVLRPPAFTERGGLYILFRESPQLLGYRQTLQNPDACVKALQELDRSGRLSQILQNSYGPWVVQEYVQGRRPKPEQFAVQDLVVRSIIPWSSPRTGHNDCGRTKELAKLKAELEYYQQVRDYDAALLISKARLETRRSEYISRKMDEFDAAELTRIEEEKWSWSPLFMSLLRDPPTTGPQRPWKHNEEEWERIIGAIREERERQQLEISTDCPSIVRMLKLFTKIVNRRGYPLAHPTLGLQTAKLVDMFKNKSAAQHLTECVQNMAETDWINFVGFEESHFEDGRKDVAVLLGADSAAQNLVIQKVRHFYLRVTRLTILDLSEEGGQEAIRSLWYNEHVPQEKCIASIMDFNRIMVMRENDGMGWTLPSLREIQNPELAGHIRKVMDSLNKLKEATFALQLGRPTSSSASEVVCATNTDSVTCGLQDSLIAHASPLNDVFLQRFKTVNVSLAAHILAAHSLAAQSLEHTANSGRHTPVRVDNHKNSENANRRARSAMKDLMVAAGLGKDSRVRFVFRGVEARLGLHDLKLLEADNGMLTINVMEWFTVWFPQYTVCSGIIVCSPCLFSALRDCIQEKDSFALPVLQEFFSMDSGLETAVGHTLVVPILHNTHWSVATLSDAGFYKFDSIMDGFFHGTERLHQCLGKLWAMFTGIPEDQQDWKRAAAMQTWKHVRCPQQDNKWACGWFTLKYISEFCSSSRENQN